MSFSGDCMRWAEKSKLSAALVLQKVTLDGIRGVQLRSPVDSGRFRGSHRVGINTPDLSVEPPPPRGQKITPDYGGAPSAAELGRALSTIGRIRWTDRAHVSNDLIYGPALEAGASAQNGNQVDGIYGATASELAGNIEALVRRTRL